MLFLNDETGENPFPPGVFVSLYSSSGSLVEAGWTQIGGLVSGVTVQGAVGYTATFRSSQVPSGVTVSFFGNAVLNADTYVTVPGFRSPTLSVQGYTNIQPTLWPQGWFGDSAVTTGGIAYMIAQSLAAGNELVDTIVQSLIASERVQSCQGSALDSWAFDFFGNFLRRFPSETDAIYYDRVTSMFGPRRTLAAIEAVVIAFYEATLAQRALSIQSNLSFDESGAYDTGGGGYDIYVQSVLPQLLMPVISVWDQQSNPTLAAVYNIAPPQFVIQIGFTGTALAWYLDQSYVDFNAYLIDIDQVQTNTTAPDSRLGAIINLLMKAAGTVPVYQTYITS